MLCQLQVSSVLLAAFLRQPGPVPWGVFETVAHMRSHTITFHPNCLICVCMRFIFYCHLIIIAVIYVPLVRAWPLHARQALIVQSIRQVPCLVRPAHMAR